MIKILSTRADLQESFFNFVFAFAKAGTTVAEFDVTNDGYELQQSEATFLDDPDGFFTPEILILSLEGYLITGVVYDDSDPEQLATISEIREALSGSIELYDYDLFPPANLDAPGETSTGDGTQADLIGDDVISGGPGDDLELFGGLGDDTVRGEAGDDAVYGNAGSDTVYGNLGRDLVFGGRDNDRVFGGRDADQVYGNLGRDQVYGNLGNDFLFGGRDNDWLFGGQGADTLYGNLGNDTLLGNKGDDVLVDNAGNDTMTGGAGADRFVISSGAGTDWITDFEAGDTIVIESNINGLELTAFDDLEIVESEVRQWALIVLAGESPSNADDLQLFVEVAPGVLGPNDFEFF